MGQAYAACCSKGQHGIPTETRDDEERLLAEGRITEDSNGNSSFKTRLPYGNGAYTSGFADPGPTRDTGGSSSCCSCFSGRCCACVCCSICTPLLVVLVPFAIILLFALNDFQIWALSNPGNPVSALYIPAISVIEGLWACDPPYLVKLQGAYGDNFASAGQVVIASWDETQTTLLSPQARTDNLGAQPLIASHFPNLDVGGRNLFLLSLSDKAAGGDGAHNAFRSAIVQYMFNQDCLARAKDETATSLLNTLVADYHAMAHGKNEEFFTSPDKGLLPYLVKMLHYVMLNMDVSDESTIDKLMEWYAGDGPIAHYIMPFGYAVNKAALIEEIADMYMESPVVKSLVPDPAHMDLTQYELAKMTTQILRVAGVTGTLQLSQTVLGGRGFPNYLGEDTASIDVLAVLDSLDLSSRDVLKGYILEVGRLYPPVTTAHHVATEDFTVEFQGKGKVTFPKGTRKLTTMGLAMLDKGVWGDNAYALDVSRSQKHNMMFNSVGDQTYSRICPGKQFVLEMLTDVLQAIGKARRAA